ncbi:MAG: 3-hydroxyacyl-ACP dehydratase [Aquaticitalea sp.]
MLLEDFYTILKSNILEEQAFEVSVEIHKEHDIFKGHFPNFPVTPGVALLQIIKNSLETHLHYSLLMKSSSNIKFLNLVNPYEESILVFNINFTFEKDLIKVKNSTSFKDGRSVMKCNVTFVKK